MVGRYQIGCFIYLNTIVYKVLSLTGTQQNIILVQCDRLIIRLQIRVIYSIVKGEVTPDY